MHEGIIRVTALTSIFLNNINIHIFTNLTITHGNPLQIAQNHANLTLIITLN